LGFFWFRVFFFLFFFLLLVGFKKSPPRFDFSNFFPRKKSLFFACNPPYTKHPPPTLVFCFFTKLFKKKNCFFFCVFFFPGGVLGGGGVFFLDTTHTWGFLRGKKQKKNLRLVGVPTNSPRAWGGGARAPTPPRVWWCASLGVLAFPLHNPPFISTKVFAPFWPKNLNLPLCFFTRDNTHPFPPPPWLGIFYSNTNPNQPKNKNPRGFPHTPNFF